MGEHTAQGPVPSVLIPSDNQSFVPELCRGYASWGARVSVGIRNLHLRLADFDAVHLQWPEELSGWEVPSSRVLDGIREDLDYWKRRCVLVGTAHNLRPHRGGGDPGFRSLYEAVAGSCHILMHFSRWGRDRFLAEYPCAASCRQFLAGPFGFPSLLRFSPDPAAFRARHGLAPGDFLVLVLGDLRRWEEVALLRDALASVGSPGLALAVVARYSEGSRGLRARVRRWRFRSWARSRASVALERYLPDEDLAGVVRAADAIVVPRWDCMSSGLHGLGVTFGKAVIAPRQGVFLEHLEGTSNFLYEPGSAVSLAEALERASRADREAIRIANEALARRWSWEAVASGLLREIRAVREGSGAPSAAGARPAGRS